MLKNHNMKNVFWVEEKIMNYALQHPLNLEDKFKDISKKHKTKITKIGVITNKSCKYMSNSKEISISSMGYDHFKT